jgi:septum formation protein
VASPPLLLASRSPQRSAILEQLGVRFVVVPADVEEGFAGPPREVVVENARRKAQAVAHGAGAGRTALGADTAVVLEDRVLGKPRSEAEARAFLEALAGRSHEVWTGIALAGASSVDREPTAIRVGAAMTEVRFRRLEPAEIDWYLATGEWRDRAGAYAIQGRGAALVERIAGDYSNVVGLPVAELVRLEPGLVGL